MINIFYVIATVASYVMEKYVMICRCHDFQLYTYD